MEGSLNRHLWIYALAFLVVASLGVNAYLFHLVLYPAKTAPRDRAYSLKVGDVVPPIEGKSLDGAPLRVDYGKGDGRPTVVYVLSPGCSWCRRNARNIETVIKRDSGRHRFVVVSLHTEGLQELAKTLPSGIELVAEVSAESRKRYFFGPSPQTLVISDEGVVLRHWNGAYDREVAEQVATYFNVVLPGLTVDVEPTSLCRDDAGRLYSRGFVAVMSGVRKECGENGKWIGATR